MAQNYFPHDYNASKDDKILELRAKHGWEGYGLFWALVERMAKLEEGTINPEKSAVMAVDFNADEGKVQSVIETCIDAGLFVEGEDGLYRNCRITKHIKKMESYSKAGKKGAKNAGLSILIGGLKGGLIGTLMQIR